VITARTSEDTRGYQKNKISISMISRYIKQLIIFYDQDMKLLTCHKKCQSSEKKKRNPTSLGAGDLHPQTIGCPAASSGALSVKVSRPTWQIGDVINVIQ
jgi:hypothetical protein